MKRTAIAFVMAVAGTVAASAQTTAETDARFLDADGNEIGTAHLTDTPNGVLIALDLSGLPASQWVAFHVHEGSDCTPDDGFESAGGHFNPSDADHGYLTETGPHAGDMPNQYVDAEGNLHADVFNPLVRLEGSNSISGRTLVIHGGTDDYKSQPSGDAGDRLACGMIE